MRTIHVYPLCWLVLLAVGLGASLNSCTNDLPETEQLVEPGTDADNILRPEDYVGKPVSFDGFTVTEVMTDADTRAVTRSDSRAFGVEGDVVTIRMDVKDPDGNSNTYIADYVLAGGTWKPKEQNNPLYWEGVDDDYYFTAYYPALNEQEKQEKGTRSISMPSDWTDENYLEYGRLMQSPYKGFDFGSTVSLTLQPLLTRIEVSIDDATGITDATHLTMYTRREGRIELLGTITLLGGVDKDPKEMNLWRDTSASTAGTPANPVFRGYALPQTYASGTTLLKHHTPDVDDARTYTVNYHDGYPDGLTTNRGEIVSFTVAAIVPTVVDVPTAGKLKEVLNDAFPTGDYPKRLKITGGLDKADLEYLAKELTISGAQGDNITVVDMEGATVGEDAFGGDGIVYPFQSYNGSIKSLVLPSSLGTVPNEAFWMSSLTSVTLPKGLVEIGKEAFGDCQDLKSITLPPSVTALGEGAFYGSGLTSIELPEDLTEVGYAAFMSCLDLQHVALPGNNSITVGERAFKGIPSSCQLYLYAPELNTTSPAQEYRSGTWGDGNWANVHWGYIGTGSKLDPKNYKHHLKEQ